MPFWRALLFGFRFSDFLVHEVDLGGKILHLEPPTPPKEAEPSAATDETADENKPTEKEAIRAEFLEALNGDEEAVDKILALIEIPKDQAEEAQEVLTKPIREKEDRAKVHRVIKKFYRDTLTSDVFGEDQQVRVRLATEQDKRALSKSNKKNNRNNRNHVNWDELGGEYLEFVMLKENRETMDVLGHVAKMAGISAKALTFAGTKDKRGVTVQRLTAHKCTKETLAAVNGRLYGARLGNFR
jgi:tRNA pseudouridine13 synthase